MTDTIDDIKQQLLQLKALHADGSLPEAAYLEGKAKLERRILDQVLAGGTPPAKAPSTLPPSAAASGPRPSPWLVSSLTVAVVVLAAAGYLWKGSVPPSMQGGDAPAAAADAQGEQQTNAAQQIAGMVDKLADRLKSRPDDVEGWTMLARSYSVLGRHAEALKAYEKALSLRKDDPALLADYADSLAVNSNNSLDGEPMKFVERALKLDPKNLKALYLAGTYAFNKKDYATAVKLWERLVAVGPAGNVFAREVEPAIAEARSLAGMPAAAGSAVVSGTVTLSAALAKQAQPDDTVFVFARAAEGSRMPLAILRKQVKDLPLTFKLDDSMAMSPTTALSSAAKVIVGARVSKSGNAMPQPGDLAGQSQPVSVGTTDIKIEIQEAVKP